MSTAASATAHRSPVGSADASRNAFYRPGTYCAETSVGYLMKRIGVAMKAEIDRRVLPLGLTDAQWGPLLRLQSVGSCTVVELARWMLVDAGAMTRLLDRLEKKNLCRRLRSTSDRRVVQVELTDEGHAAVAAVPAVLADVMNDHLSGFTASEHHQLVDLLKRIVSNSDAIRDSSCRSG